MSRPAALLIAFLALSGSAATVAEGDEEDWTSLSELSAWRPYGDEIGRQWKAEPGGVLHLTAGGGGDLVTSRDYGSFVLEFDWKIPPGGNSGVLYRVVPGAGKPSDTGLEYQLLDAESPPTGATAALWGLYAPKGGAPKPAGEWNSAKITVDGNRVGHFLNGRKVVTATIGSDDWNERAAAGPIASRPRFAKADRGRICLQDYGTEVWFRNIRVKPLD